MKAVTDAYRLSRPAPSIEFAIRLWRSPKKLKTFGFGESYSTRGGFSSASQRFFSERSRIADKFKRRRALDGGMLLEAEEKAPYRVRQ